MPFRLAPKTVAMDCLTSYQTDKFGEETGFINFVAPVRGQALIARAQLRHTQPKHFRAAIDRAQLCALGQLGINIGEVQRMGGPASQE
jgi:hypothetical protein